MLGKIAKETIPVTVAHDGKSRHTEIRTHERFAKAFLDPPPGFAVRSIGGRSVCEWRNFAERGGLPAGRRTAPQAEGRSDLHGIEIAVARLQHPGKLFHPLPVQ